MKEHSRYERQIILKEIGREGQRRLDASCIAIVGLGALGSVSANLLARAGVGRIRLIDRDFLELNNLQRQILYDETDLLENLPKAVAAAKKLQGINSQITIESEVADLNSLTVEPLLKGVDLIVDGTDNFETRFLINDYCLANGVAWIYGGAVRTEGMSYVIIPGLPPCLRCLFGEVPKREDMQTCDQVGILAPVAHLIASFQATEAIKILAGHPDRIDRRLWKVDIWSRHFKAYAVDRLKANPCSGCSEQHFPYLTHQTGSRSVVLCGRNSVQIYEPRSEEIHFERIAKRLENHGRVQFNNYLLNVKMEPFEITVFRNGRAIIKGTEDAGRARSLYARYIGA